MEIKRCSATERAEFEADPRDPTHIRDPREERPFYPGTKRGFVFGGVVFPPDIPRRTFHVPHVPLRPSPRNRSKFT